MVRSGLVRFMGAPLVALLAALTLAPGSVMAADPGCSVTADPQSAVGGSVFTFTGSGFHPTKLLLQKGDGGPITNDIDPTGDPWTQVVQSRAGDEGSWTATFLEEDGCVIAVSFQVTLSATDVISDLLSDQPETKLPALFYLMVVGFGLVGGAFLSRRLGAARSGLRP
ncbi:MAG: hypothetical protein QOJ81_1073 [Chloroflexota bacterium]|nr:hypothetical protein [Chloroflexota bacterium]